MRFDCDDSVEIEGAHGGMTFREIREILGQAAIEETYIETPDHPAYEMIYESPSNGVIIGFLSQLEDGADSCMYLRVH